MAQKFQLLIVFYYKEAKSIKFSLFFKKGIQKLFVVAFCFNKLLFNLHFSVSPFDQGGDGSQLHCRKFPIISK